MRHLVKINSNPNRSFCYYNENGKRVKIYNGKKFNKDIFPNREKNIEKRKAQLNELREIIYSSLYTLQGSQEKILSREADNAYDQSIFKERINNTLDKEFLEAKNQVKKIAMFRLEEIIK